MMRSLTQAAISTVQRLILISFALCCVPIHLGICAALPTQNLLTNASFENNLAAWTTVSSQAEVVSYGDSNAPIAAVSTRIGGGGRVLRNAGGYGGNGAVIEQVVSIGSVPAGTNLRAGGYFGGGADSSDDARLVVRFLDQFDGEISRQNLLYATQSNRNYEFVLLKREAILAIPASTSKIAARIEFRHPFYSVPTSVADCVFLELVTTPILPTALPVSSELLNNPGFDLGWTGSSPLTLTDSRGWEGSGTAYAIVRQYSTTDVNFVPSTAVAAILGGGGSLLTGANYSAGSNGHAAVHQLLDIRGNQNAIATLELQTSCCLGGIAATEHTSQLNIRFLDTNLSAVSPVETIGPITRAQRNSETALLRRTRKYSIPVNTAYIDVEVYFTNVNYSISTGLADNISVMLVPVSTPAAIPLNTNLLSNPSFDSGSSLPGSPLELGNPTGWEGSADDTSITKVLYGSGTDVPLAPVSGLGGNLARDLGGNGAIRQRIDLSGSIADIDAGNFKFTASAWLGGIGSYSDSAEVRIKFLNEFENLLGAMTTLGPVTAADRANTTKLMLRSTPSALIVPTGSRTLEVELRFHSAFYQHTGFADGLKVSLQGTGGSGGSGNASPDSFDASRVSAAGLLLKALLTTQGTYIGKSPQLQDPAKLSSAISVAEKAFGKAFDAAAQSATKAGAATTYNGSAAAVISLADIDKTQIASIVTLGLDTGNPIDRSLRSTIMKASAAMFQAYLSGESANIKSPSASKLEATRQKAKATFLKAATAAITSASKKSITYNGVDVNSLPGTVQSMVSQIADLLH